MPLELNRRDFMRASAASAGGLLLAFSWPQLDRVAAASMRAADADPLFAPNAFVRIAPDGQITVIINKAEMGQGVCTSLSMLLAEELDAEWARVGFEFAPAEAAYAHPGFGIQMTGGSTSIAGMAEPMRKAGAAARAMLVAAAAQRWGVDAAACETRSSRVRHPASGRELPYGELANAAAALALPASVTLKEVGDFRLIGTAVARLDTPAKVQGTAEFSIDVRRPGMLTAVVAHPPTFGGRARSVDSTAALAVRGVQRVVEVSSGVAVIATGFWAAKRGRDLLKIDWDLGPNAHTATDALRAHYRELSRTPGLMARREGDAVDALRSAATVLSADYELPYLAHAPMEPLNCVVDLRPDSCEVWAGTQFQTVDQAAVARVVGLSPTQVRLHTTFMGGGFGRRANPASDYLVEAAEIARAAGAPLQLIWTREDDMRSGFYRPMWHNHMLAGIDATGKLNAWRQVIVGQSILAGTPFEPFFVKDGIDGTSVEGAADMVYSIPNLQVELHTTHDGIPTLWWRSVGHSHTAFAVECFLDEIAHATGQDPYRLRRKLLAEHPRHLGVLDRAAEAAGWGQPLAPGRARGIAVHHSFGSYVAQVAEVSLVNGRPRVHRVTCAIDCGWVVNPDTIVAQIEGAVGFALTAVLHGAITLRDGRVEQGNFNDYKLLRVHEMPAVDVHIVPRSEAPSGVGEPGVPPLAPAVCNALFALTQRRIRRLPIRSEDLVA
ncbi:MAG: molybdopterin cofactor-binding domain-containing protein [Planctomycetota bacterium]